MTLTSDAKMTHCTRAMCCSTLCFCKSAISQTAQRHFLFEEKKGYWVSEGTSVR